MEWVASLGHRALQPKTIKSYLSAVRSLHIDEGLPFDACESESVHRVIRGIKRFYGEKARSPKLPVLLGTLQRLTATSGDLSNRFNAVFDAAIKVAWAGFLRCGEFTLGSGQIFNPSVHLSRASVTFIPSIDPTHFRLDLPFGRVFLFLFLQLLARLHALSLHSNISSGLTLSPRHLLFSPALMGLHFQATFSS